MFWWWGFLAGMFIGFFLGVLCMAITKAYLFCIVTFSIFISTFLQMKILETATDLEKFQSDLLSRYFEATNFYYAEYSKLRKSRSVKENFDDIISEG